jgi:protein-tyrosine phosphatase
LRKVVDVLVVCTANVARSPLFAARLQLEADQRLGPGTVEVASAGVHAVYGVRAAVGARTVSARWERPLEEHHALPITHHHLAQVQLVLTMEAAHKRDLIRRERSLASRVFTVRELATIVTNRIDPLLIAEAAAAGSTGAHARLRRVVALADARRPRRLARRSSDVPDPIGRGQATYDQLGEQFEAAAAVLASALFGPAQGPES